MSPQIALNGVDISTYGLVPLSGTISTLLAPRKYKKLVTNENSYIHGSLVLSSPSSRRYEKKEMSLSFFLYAASQSALKTALDNLEQLLIKGKNEGTQLQPIYNGVNELSLPEYGICLRVIFEEVSKFTPWVPHNCAVITLKFIEPNPNNRTMPSNQ